MTDEVPRELQVREALILGQPPRIPPLAVDEMSADLIKIVTQMMAVNSAVPVRSPEMLTDMMSDHAAGASDDELAGHFANLSEIIRTMLRHPELFARQVEVSGQLLGHGTLPARDRELAILRVGWLCRAPYEWGEHVHIAKNLGVSAEEVERVTAGSSAPGWSEHDRALLSAVEELLADSMISDATWDVLARRYDEKQLIELPVVIGQYQTTAYYQNSLRLRLHEGNPGLRAR